MMATEQELRVGDEVELCCGRTLRVLAVDEREVTFALEGEGAGPVLLCSPVAPGLVLIDTVLMPQAVPEAVRQA